MLKKILKEATRIEQWQQEIYTDLHNFNAEWITSGRLNISRLPTSSEANRFLVVRTANADPVYDVIVAGDIPGLDASKIVSGTFDVARIPDLDASKITSGRFPLSRLPTSSTANRFLVVRTANTDPVYDVIAAADIPGLDASKIVSGRFSVSRLPDGTSGYVLVGQGTGYDMAWRDISGIAGTITDSQHGTKTGIPFAHHGDWAHYGKIPTSAPTGAAERAYVDSANLYVHDGTSWVLRATKDWNNLINKPSTFPPSAHASSHEYGGTDLVRNLDYLAIRGTTVITSGRVLQNIASVAQTLLPDADNTRALGSSSYRWSDVRTALLNGWNPDAHASRHGYGGADAVSLDASQITSGRLSLSRLPTSATANRVLLVRTANADPTYDQVDWNTDIKNIPSTFPPSAHASTHEYGGTDLVTNLDYLAIRGTTVITGGRVLQNIPFVAQNLLPYADNTYDLGSSALRWRNLYLAGAADVGSLKIGGTVVITSDRMLSNIAYLATSLVPYLDNTYDIGASLSRIRNIYVAGTANVGSLQIGGTTVIDSSRNLTNIASATVSGTANVGSLQIGGTTVIDSSRKLQNIASVAQNLVPDANLTRDLGTSSVAWNNLYVGYGFIGRLTVTDQIRDNTNTYQMAKILSASGTSRNTPAWVFFPTSCNYSLLPATSDYGYIGESDRYWYMMYSYVYYYKVTPASFSCPSKLKDVPIEKALGVKVEGKTLPKGLKVRYKAPTPHSEDAYKVKDLIRERLGFNMAPLEREYTKHLLQKHNGDFESALREAKEFFGEELDSYGRTIKERLEKKMPIEDEIALDELVSVYGEQAVAEALEILKFELHDQIEIA